MALPIAHCSLALGLTRSGGGLRAPALACFLCLLPDFDFLLVIAAGQPISYAHRTFSHSLAFYLLLTALWAWMRPGIGDWISLPRFFAILLSHSVLDMLCTADRFDHGVMLFWPWSDVRLGWPVLVPLYRLFGDTPFSLQGAISFTVLEAILAWPLWKLSRALSGQFRLERFGLGGRRRRLSEERVRSDAEPA